MFGFSHAVYLAASGCVLVLLLWQGMGGGGAEGGVCSYAALPHISPMSLLVCSTVVRHGVGVAVSFVCTQHCHIFAECVGGEPDPYAASLHACAGFWAPVSGVLGPREHPKP